jgi:hypothetical protein
MNKILILFLFLVALMTSNCGNSTKREAARSRLQPADTGIAKISFREYDHNFGKVREGEKADFIFAFENKGTASLIVSSVTTSCGCTVPKYDSKPILPGKEGTIEVVFDTSGRNGMQAKAITVKSNALTPVVLLKITAEVVTDTNK